MGGSQSKQLKKELTELKSQATLAKLRHEEELESVRREKRELQVKLDALQELTVQAELAVEKANQQALESEERAKALKWELVRKLTVPTVAPSSRTSTTATSLAATESSSPRVTLNWKLRDGVSLRRSSTSMLPPSGTVDAAMAARLGKQRPHAQSEPVMPQKQVQQYHDLKPNVSHLETGSSRSDACDPTAKAKAANNNNNNNNEDEMKATEPAPVPRSSSHSTASSASSSSEDEKPPSKYPALSRKQAALVPAPHVLDESKASSSDQSEPESELLERGRKTRQTDREAKSEEGEHDESDRDISKSRSSRDDDDVLTFLSVEDDSS